MRELCDSLLCNAENVGRFAHTNAGWELAELLVKVVVCREAKLLHAAGLKLEGVQEV